MTYNVFGGTLNLALSIYPEWHTRQQFAVKSYLVSSLRVFNCSCFTPSCHGGSVVTVERTCPSEESERMCSGNLDTIYSAQPTVECNLMIVICSSTACAVLSHDDEWSFHF